jgi:hypothetical protein
VPSYERAVRWVEHAVKMGTELLPQYYPDVLRAQFSLAHGYIDKVPEKRAV